MKNYSKSLNIMEKYYNIEFTTLEKLRFSAITESVILLCGEEVMDDFMLDEISEKIIKKYEKIAKERADIKKQKVNEIVKEWKKQWLK